MGGETIYAHKDEVLEFDIRNKDCSAEGSASLSYVIEEDV